jgi:hypothetical protein
MAKCLQWRGAATRLLLLMEPTDPPLPSHATEPFEPAPPLAEPGRAILEFERTWWQQPGAKEAAIRDRFGFSGTKYYRLLNELLDDPEACRHDPLTVKRLRRRREQLRRARVHGHPAGHPGSGSRP